MKIALITDGISPYVMGGMQKHSFYLVKYMTQNKIHVDLFHFNQSNYNIDELEFFSAGEKEYINSIVLDFPKLDKLPGHYLRESHRYSELVFEKIKNQLDTYDFIYTKGFSGWKLIEEKKKGLLCPPIGVKFHGYEMFQTAPTFKVKLQHLLLRKPVKWINQNADFVFSYGGKISEIIKKLSVASDKIIEIPTGIESGWINDNSGKVNDVRRFVYVGRYERRKGIEELNQAIKATVVDHEYIIEFIGPIAKDKQIDSQKVIYHGEIRDIDRIKKILQNADVLVCPSYSEGMPNVILEGMASGLAIIASDVGAVNEQVNSLNGLLIQPGNVEMLQNSIVRMVAMPENELKSMKQASIDRIRKYFLWENIIFRLIDQIKNRVKL